MNNIKKSSVWFITGASKGLGLTLTNLLLSLGHKVIATSRNTAAMEKGVTGNRENLFPLEMDVTSDKDVKAAVDKAFTHFGSIDVVVNNAGYSLVGSMEEMTDEEFRSTKASRAAAKLLRQVLPTSVPYP